MLSKNYEKLLKDFEVAKTYNENCILERSLQIKTAMRYPFTSTRMDGHNKKDRE